ncbi:uncharacterized protein LOC134240931 [Saccostrea cucullata]|uniref:uncharacterized protein LOC134240931 n=1 Tax=Saccostrea cuccullata TaxID=36930 RepID=UPI002ED4FB87
MGLSAVLGINGTKKRIPAHYVKLDFMVQVAQGDVNLHHMVEIVSLSAIVANTTVIMLMAVVYALKLNTQYPLKMHKNLYKQKMKHQPVILQAQEKQFRIRLIINRPKILSGTRKKVRKVIIN